MKNRINPSMILRKKLEELIKHRGITASQLARESKVPKQTISGWLAGQTPKNVNQIKSVATCLGVSVDELCFDCTATNTINVNKFVVDEWFTAEVEIKIKSLKKRSKK